MKSFRSSFVQIPKEYQDYRHSIYGESSKYCICSICLCAGEGGVEIELCNKTVNVDLKSPTCDLKIYYEDNEEKFDISIDITEFLVEKNLISYEIIHSSNHLVLYINDAIIITDLTNAFAGHIIENYGLIIGVHSGTACILHNNGYMGILDIETDSWILYPEFRSIFNLVGNYVEETRRYCPHNSTVYVNQGLRYGKYDIASRMMVIPCIFDEVAGSNVRMNNKWARYDHIKNGALDWHDDIFGYAFHICGGYEKVHSGFNLTSITLYRDGDKYGYWDCKGFQYPAMFDAIKCELIRDGEDDYFIIVKKDGLYGVIDIYGTPILDPIYEEVSDIQSINSTDSGLQHVHYSIYGDIIDECDTRAFDAKEYFVDWTDSFEATVKVKGKYCRVTLNNQPIINAYFDTKEELNRALDDLKRPY